jgi:hypothetical protein
MGKKQTNFSRRTKLQETCTFQGGVHPHAVDSKPSFKRLSDATSTCFLFLGTSVTLINVHIP